jgi:hypothetical protein
VNGDPLSEFQRDIAPFRPVWQSARISGLATRDEGNWISLGLRVSLSELPSERLEIVKPFDWFVYFDERCPLDHFDRVAEELVRGRYLTIPPDTGTEGSGLRIYLNRQAAETLAHLDEEVFQQGRTPNVPRGPTWYYYGFVKRGLFRGSYGTDRAHFALTANGERHIDLLDYQDRLRVDSKLRAAESAFDGIRELAQLLLPGLYAHSPNLDRGESQFQVVAPLPFFLDCPEPARLALHAPAATPSGALGLRFFFGPEAFPPSTLLRLRPQNAMACNAGMIEWRLDIPWPPGSATAKATLFFMDREVDSLEVNRWPAGANMRVALDDYFDPGRRKLLEGLGLETGRGGPKLQARQFEAAVARLMSLLGIPLIWYGDWLAEQGRSDLGGVTGAAGKKVAILAEGTLSKPEEKFSELHKRADEVAARLGTEAEVMAVVFTSAPTTQSEVQRAAEHQIVLVGPDELRRFLVLLQSPEDPSKALEILRQFRGAPPLGPPAWPPQLP